MPKELDFENLRICLDNYEPIQLYIRDCGGTNPDGSYRFQGMQKVNVTLEDKTLDFRKDSSGLYMLIDKNEVFHFPLRDYYKGFSLAYERRYEDGRYVMLQTGFDPDDPNLPEPKRSFLRTVIDGHQMEIFFQGKIPLRFHSWWNEPHWKYWTIDV